MESNAKVLQANLDRILLVGVSTPNRLLTGNAPQAHAVDVTKSAERKADDIQGIQF
jgi:hypothetical protein